MCTQQCQYVDCIYRVSEIDWMSDMDPQSILRAILFYCLVQYYQFTPDGCVQLYLGALWWSCIWVVYVLTLVDILT